MRNPDIYYDWKKIILFTTTNNIRGKHIFELVLVQNNLGKPQKVILLGGGDAKAGQLKEELFIRIKIMTKKDDH